MNLYAIRDRLACEFAPPFVSRNHDTAVRTARQMFLKVPSSSDFELYFLGQFDQVKGTILSIEPENISFFKLENIKEENSNEG